MNPAQIIRCKRCKWRTDNGGVWFCLFPRCPYERDELPEPEGNGSTITDEDDTAQIGPKSGDC